MSAIMVLEVAALWIFDQVPAERRGDVLLVALRVFISLDLDGMIWKAEDIETDQV